MNKQTLTKTKKTGSRVRKCSLKLHFHQESKNKERDEL